MRLRRTLLVASTAVAGLALGTSSAWAYFSSTGAGGGTAAAGQLSVRVLTAEPAGGLLPGGRTAAVLKLYNPQPVPITVVSVQGAGAAVADNGCGPTGVGFTDQDGLALSIPAGATTEVTLPGAVSMSPDAAPACQGTGFNIPVTVTVRS